MTLVYANAPAQPTRSVTQQLNTWDAIIHAINYRRTYAGRLINDMVRIRDIYNGDIVIPMADVKGEPDSRPAIPALVNQAVDSPAQRAASVAPQSFFPALHPERDTGVGSMRYADLRRRASNACWHFSGLREVLIPKAYRQFRAYGTWSLFVRPDFDEGRARIEIRDPLNTYPDLRVNDVTMQPKNVGFMTFRSRAWLVSEYGPKSAFVAKMVAAGNGQAVATANNLVGALANSNRDDSDIFEMVEWVDHEAHVVGVIGPRYYQQESTAYPQWPIGGFELTRWQNRAEMVPASIPYRVTLDRIMGAVNLIVPMVNKMARLDLLEYFSAEKAVFPDLVIFGKDAEPRLVGGAWNDGRTGQPNLIEGGDVKYLNTTPGPMTQQRIDQLERAIRNTSGNPAMFNGEATGNIRSGQTVNQLGSYSVDPDTQEMQMLMGRSLAVVNEAYMAVEKGYWPKKTFRVFSGWASDPGQVIYTPGKHFETKDNVVKYPLPGLDVTSATVAVGQMVGTGLMSKRTGRMIHPMIENPAGEEDMIGIERLEDALLAGVLTQLQQPPQPGAGGAQLVDAATMLDRMRNGDTIDKAVLAAQAVAQQRQASMAPPPGPGMMTAPGAQPGLSAPGAGAEQPQMPPGMPGMPPGGPPGMPGMPPGGPPPTPSQENLKALFRAINAK